MTSVTLASRQRGAVNLVVVLLIVLIVALLGTGAGLAYYLKHLTEVVPTAAANAAPAEGPGNAAGATGKPIYMELDPPLIVNFDRRGRIGFLQATIQVMARDQRVLDAAREHVPVVRNNLLMLLSGKSYEEMTGREARETLRLEALAEVNKVLAEQGFWGRVEDLYFTGFVMQ